MGFFNTTHVACGIDISDRALRLIQLKRRGKKFKVQIYNEISLPGGAVIDGVIKEATVVSQALDKLIKTRHGRGRVCGEAIVALPETKTFLKIINVPSDQEDINAYITQVLPEHFPITADEVYFDWQKAPAYGPTAVLLGICPRAIVDSYYQVFQNGHVTPIAFEIEAAAISRALLAESDPAVAMIIDIGANRTGLMVVHNGAVQFTVSLPVSGRALTDTIASTLDLTFDQAEQAKIICGLDNDKCHGALVELFDQTFDELTSHIKQAMAYHQQSMSDSPAIERVIMTGGGANFQGIDKILSQKLGLPVTITQLWSDELPNPDHHFFTDTNSRPFTTVVGLAKRGLMTTHI